MGFRGQARRPSDPSARAEVAQHTSTSATHRLEELRALASSWGFSLPLLERVSLRIEEVASTTGLSESMIRKLIRAGELPAARVGAVVLILTKDLIAFLESHVADQERVAEGIAREITDALERGSQ